MEENDVKDVTDRKPVSVKTVYPCTICGRKLSSQTNLTVHMQRWHAPKPADEEKAEELEIDTDTATPDEETGYHCIACWTTVAKNETPCPGCGSTLDWSSL